jgi:hypothetical protein
MTVSWRHPKLAPWEVPRRLPTYGSPLPHRKQPPRVRPELLGHEFDRHLSAGCRNKAESFGGCSTPTAACTQAPREALGHSRQYRPGTRHRSDIVIVTGQSTLQLQHESSSDRLTCFRHCHASSRPRGLHPIVAPQLPPSSRSYASIVGTAHEQWLSFATGGLAIAEPTFFRFRFFPFPGTANAASFFIPQWSLKAEYLYVDLGTKSFTSTNSNPTTFPLATILHNHSLVENIGRVGLNFHF